MLVHSTCEATGATVGTGGMGAKGVKVGVTTGSAGAAVTGGGVGTS